MKRAEGLIFTIIPYGSEEYQNAASLREEILRRPLGLTFLPEELEAEKDHIHIVGYRENTLCATAVLVPEGDELKIQRVAVAKAQQNRGIGSSLMFFCEDYAHQRGFKAVYCHARTTAILFYRKHKYRLEGEPFDEDGIPHYKMRKALFRDPHQEN